MSQSHEDILKKSWAANDISFYIVFNAGHHRILNTGHTNILPLQILPSKPHLVKKKWCQQSQNIYKIWLTIGLSNKIPLLSDQEPIWRSIMGPPFMRYCSLISMRSCFPLYKKTLEFSCNLTWVRSWLAGMKLTILGLVKSVSECLKPWNAHCSKSGGELHIGPNKNYRTISTMWEWAYIWNLSPLKAFSLIDSVALE